MTDLVPGSAADVQTQYDARTKRELRVRVGDRVVCVDGAPLDGQANNAAIRTLALTLALSLNLNPNPNPNPHPHHSPFTPTLTLPLAPTPTQGIDAVITPAEQHVLMVERERKDDLVTKPSTRTRTRTLTLPSTLTLTLALTLTR